MRRTAFIVLAALLGAGSYLAYDRWRGPSRAPSGAPPARAGAEEPWAEPGTPSLAVANSEVFSLPGGPILSDGDPSGGLRPAATSPAISSPGSGAARAAAGEGTGRLEETKRAEPAAARPVETVSKPPSEGTATAGDPPAPQGAAPTAAPPAATAAPPPEIEGQIRLARAAFAAGDQLRGVKILREVFQTGKDRPEVDLVPQVRQLLEVEERGANDRPVKSVLEGPDRSRLELYRYLAARDQDPAQRYRIALGLGSLEARESDPESVKDAWGRLTQAFLAAASPAERKAVIAVLDPFLKRNVFSKRFSPLLASHTVKAGESLNRIARSRGTTEEAIQRLNQMQGEVIQPGQRLLVLEGKPQIFVKKSEFRLWLLVGDRLLLDAMVGLGRDNSTPVSEFQIAVRQKDPIWYRRGEAPIPSGDPKNILGSRWLGFKETVDLTGFGIHGTADPSSIGKEESSGCIRMLDLELKLLWDFVPLGTPVTILE